MLLSLSNATLPLVHAYQVNKVTSRATFYGDKLSTDKVLDGLVLHHISIIPVAVLELDL